MGKSSSYKLIFVFKRTDCDFAGTSNSLSLVLRFVGSARYL